MHIKKYYKRNINHICLLLIIISLTLTGCNTNSSYSGMQSDSLLDSAPINSLGIAITDSLGNSVTLNSNARVVSLYGSFSECWLLSGGKLVGVTEDAINEHHLELADSVATVGSIKEPNLEQIVALQPDYVILSADLTAHTAIENNLKQLGIAYGYFRIDTFNDYQNIMQQFCNFNNRSDLYQKNVLEVSDKISKIKKSVQLESFTPTVLLIRAYASGIKAKGADNVAGYILKEFNCINITEQYPSILEDLSVEQIIQTDPDYIFILTMGDEEKALSFVQQNMLSNPSFMQLRAIKNNHYQVLPKDLFHYKPNNRWSESYEYIKDILYR